MKINPHYFAAFFIGIFVGGLVIGFVNVNRPRPLFSAASVPECQHLITNYNRVVAELNERPITNQTEWETKRDTIDPMYLDIQDCTNAICLPMSDRATAYGRERDRWSEEVDNIALERDEFENNHPQPWSKDEQAEWESINLRGFYAEDQVMYYTERFEEAENQWDEAGCDDDWESELDSVDPLPAEPTSGSGTGSGSY